MAKSVFTGWRTVTPGQCIVCGYDDLWECDGRGNVTCCTLDDDDLLDGLDELDLEDQLAVLLP